MKKQNWVWMPHAGHFIGSYSCHYWLNTYVGGYIVSTVGEYDPKNLANQQWETLGIEQTYETFVFPAKKETDKEWHCCPWKASDYIEVDSLPATDRTQARLNHMKLCKKWSSK